MEGGLPAHGKTTPLKTIPSKYEYLDLTLVVKAVLAEDFGCPPKFLRPSNYEGQSPKVEQPRIEEFHKRAVAGGKKEKVNCEL